MQTLLLEKPGQFNLVDRPEPQTAGAGMALVRVNCAGVCGTDLHAYKGRQPFFEYPRVLGHELGVEVLAVGDGVSNVKPGDRCCVEPYLNCGRCIACRRGRFNCCTSLKVLGVHTDGGYCSRIVVPAVKLHRSAKLSFEQLALIETLGIGAHAVCRAAIEPGEWVLVLGAGPIGLAVMQFVKAAGGRLIVADISPQRLEFCRKQVGADNTVDARQTPLEQVRAITNSDLPTAVFDATGNPQSMHDAFGYVANSGRLVFVGLFQGDVTFRDPEFHRREMTLLASRNATPADFARIISLVEAGSIDTTPWITHRAKLADAAAQFNVWTDPSSGTIKAMIAI